VDNTEKFTVKEANYNKSLRENYVNLLTKIEGITQKSIRIIFSTNSFNNSFIKDIMEYNKTEEAKHHPVVLLASSEELFGKETHETLLKLTGGMEHKYSAPYTTVIQPKDIQFTK